MLKTVLKDLCTGCIKCSLHTTFRNLADSAHNIVSHRHTL
jgi:Na+-translocating ferredoxin:NAD+ oxidoreductase RNF subunit RnfB